MNELNRKIAESLGWTRIIEEEWWVEGWSVYDQMQGLVGCPPGKDFRCPLPDYEHSLDDAWELLPDMPPAVVAGLFGLLPIGSTEQAARLICDAYCEHRGIESGANDIH
jgi:hypothetical protein